MRMCHTRSKNHKINLFHESCLRIIYCDKNSTFEELLDKDGFVMKYKRNLQFLAIEMFKVPKISASTIFTKYSKKKIKKKMSKIFIIYETQLN